ncbi:hypothetical protein [Streptomyces cylindrosporus]|uniref:hypothetical protein n=1 Tax=Streptomyces cylindrosporus TaxID=2927583 RepID=UPI00355912A5
MVSARAGPPHPRQHQAVPAVQRDREVHEWLSALKWTLSRLGAEPVTQGVAQAGAVLLRSAGLHGHKHAIDAMLCATALQHPGRVTILTSDMNDIGRRHRSVQARRCCRGLPSGALRM